MNEPTMPAERKPDTGPSPDSLVTLEGVSKRFPGRTADGRPGEVQAVNSVDLVVGPNEVVGLVGESGSGKSTIGRLAVGLHQPTEGTVTFENKPLADLRGAAARQARTRMQMIFQDPYSSLNPRMTVGAAIAEVLSVHKLAQRSEIKGRVTELLGQVGLGATAAGRYPRSFSGGQLQRISIARALAAQPDFIVADEAVSALDVSVQADIINLFARIQGERRFGMLFISHDLGVVEIIADRVVVLYLGRVMEDAPADVLYRAPRHPYTRALLSAVPGSGRTRIVLPGESPSPMHPPSGCVFRTRCPYAQAKCAESVPAPVEVEPGHRVACFVDEAMQPQAESAA